MAMFPCSQCGRRFKGKSSTVYVAYSVGSDMERQRLRLCPDHASFVRQLVSPNEVPLDDDGSELDVDFPCLTCGSQAERENSRQLFVTAYWPGEERRDYWSSLHAGCPVPPLLERTSK